MPISSLVIQTQPDQITSVIESINDLPGASVTKQQDGKLIVITETENNQQDRALWDQMELINGVVAVDAIYHNFETLGDELK